MENRKTYIVAAAVTAVFWTSIVIGAERSTYVASPLEGQVIDMQSSQPLANAVVSAAWILAADSRTDLTRHSPRLHTEQVLTDADGVFRIVGWSGKKSAPSGWILIPGHDPLVRVYKNGYEHAELNGSELRAASKRKSTSLATSSVGTIHLRPIGNPAARDSALPRFEQLREWSIWKTHLMDELAAAKWSSRELSSAKRQRLLYELVESNCLSLDEPTRHQVCVEPESDTAKTMKHVTTQARHVKKMEHGPTIDIRSGDNRAISPVLRGELSVDAAPAGHATSGK